MGDSQRRSIEDVHTSMESRSPRRFTRRPVQLPAHVRLHGREVPAVAENVCPGGAFLRVDLSSDLPRSVIASIELPQGRHLEFEARVTWRRQSPPGVGLQFLGFLPPRPA